MKSAKLNLVQSLLPTISASKYSTSVTLIVKPVPNLGLTVAVRPSVETWMSSSDSKALRQARPGAGSNQLLSETVSLPPPPMKVSSPPFGQ